MEKIVRQTLLFDFYGELLTERQQKIYEAVVCNDTGYSEIAASEGISRQGVYDLVRRCDRQLDYYEEKLHLVERFLLIREQATRLKNALGHALESGADTDLKALLDMTDSILEEL